MKIGYFKHWFRPPYEFINFAKEQGYDIEEINFKEKNYLEGFDVAIIEQNGFNDFIENDENYINEWVKSGGVLLFMAQDYKRYAPYFLPSAVGYTQLIHRHVVTIGGCSPQLSGDNDLYKNYMMPWIESAGKKLFSYPELIEIDEMIGWKIKVNTFYQGKPKDEDSTEKIQSSAVSCYLLNDKWEVLGSYMDPAVRDGALIAKANYGKGMYFLNQLLFPEVLDENAERCLNFWKKYLKNLISYFECFKNGEREDYLEDKKEMPIKTNYKLAIHMHSLDWFGCDSHPGTINAMMRYKGFDICSIAIKHTSPYGDNFSVDKYSDDKVLFLDGQEYHPFNWIEKNSSIGGHNAFHILAVGIDKNAYTTEFTKSLYSESEIDGYLKKAISHIHSSGGVACATHPYSDYFINYDYDAVDVEPMEPLSGSNVERAWLNGKKFALMNSVDLFGFRRFLDYPAVNFIYLDGAPCRESVINAIKNRRVIAGTMFDECDIRLGDYFVGDEIPTDKAKNLNLSVYAKTSEGNVESLRIYVGENLAIEKSGFNSAIINENISLKDIPLSKFLRVEIQGESKLHILNSTPFFFIDGSVIN